MIPGKGSVVGERFVTHPLVRKVCFTGSTEVGKQIMAGCADQVKRVTLELGGKSANIVFADADIAAGGRLRAVRRLRQRRPGLLRAVADPGRAVGVRRVPRSPRDRRCRGCGSLDPRDESSEMGPLISAQQRDSVQGYLDEVDVAFAGATPDGAGLLGAADGGDRRRPRRAGSGARRSSARSSR